ncbi:histidine kinase [Ornithinimicrobium sp. F0845]|uniref:sensor histidine kinase n=1 Tax=Ornithinimicrobium sp. F0845 TaxID=2926412 RepID=UPI001FF1D670|nr:histidine kinase [Ornithinimicrobium sp. F0845]MCK0110741.1 histidine kinase [Ornithinimicrobium sp. F0845]
MSRWRGLVVLALACAGLDAFLLAGEGIARYAVPPVAAVAVLAVGLAPWAGLIGVVAAMVLSGWLGVPTESPALLPATLAVTYLAGRSASTWPGPAGVAAVALTAWVQDDLGVGTLVFAAVVLGTVWAFGRVVRRRTEAAEAAGEEAARIAALDPVAASGQVVLAERQRLATEAVAVLQTAVTDMRRASGEAAGSLGEDDLTAVHRRGVVAVQELRRLLGLLRQDPEGEGSDAHGDAEGVTDERPPARRSRWPWRWHEWATALLALALVPVGLGPEALEPSSLDVGVVLCVVPLLQRIRPFAAALLLGGVPLLTLALGAPPLDGMSEVVVTVAAAWRVGAAGDRVLGAGLAGLLLSRVVYVMGHDPGNLMIELALVGMPLLAGAAWGEKDRAYRRARDRATTLHEVHDGIISAAVAQERLRIARELHDVASHAVGAMVLQSAAALSHREQDPERARRALGFVDTAGAEALGELRRLRSVLRGDADGPASPPPDLQDVVARVGQGLEVHLDAEALPQDPVTAAFIRQVVHEGLANASRHAPGSRVDVHVGRSPGGWVVDIVDDGPAAPGAAVQSTGYGLVGLAERARALGGEVIAGPTADGGFALRASLRHTTPAAERVEA